MFIILGYTRNSCIDTIIPNITGLVKCKTCSCLVSLRCHPYPEHTQPSTTSSWPPVGSPESHHSPPLSCTLHQHQHKRSRHPGASPRPPHRSRSLLHQSEGYRCRPALQLPPPDKTKPSKRIGFTVTLQVARPWNHVGVEGYRLSYVSD